MNKLLHVVKITLTSALIGLFAGLGLGLVIWSIVSLLATTPDGFPPREVGAFLGMGLGTVLGAIFGGIVGLKEK